MSGSQSSSSFDELVGAGVFLLIAVIAGKWLEQRRMEEELQAQEALALIDQLLNEGTGNVLGDSDLSFRWQDTLGHGLDDTSSLQDMLAEIENEGS